jgi:DNA-binding MarR family transcriptional regulator
MSTEPKTQPRIRLRELLQRVELAGSYHRAARARHLGIPQIELTAMEHLSVLGGLTPGELGHRLGLTSGGVTALTGRLMEAGWVARSRHPDDGRMRVLSVTPAGEELLREHVEPVLETDDGPLGALPAAEAELVARALAELAARREAAAAATPGPERVYQADGYTRALLM